MTSQGPSSNHTVNFDTKPSARSYLSANLTQAVADYLPIDEGRFAFSAQDFLLELHDLVLSGLQVVGLETKSGLQRVSIKFKSFIGNAVALFNPKDTPFFLNDVSCSLSARTISDLVLPILNTISTFDTHGHGENRITPQNLKTMLHKMRDRKDEIEFQLTLLQRYIGCCDKTQAHSTSAHL